MAVPIALLLLLLLASNPELLLWVAGAVAIALLIKFVAIRNDDLEVGLEVDGPINEDLLVHIESLFGTTNIDLIDESVSAMYEELDKLRAASAIDTADQGNPDEVRRMKQRLAAITNERDKAISISERWQSKAIANDEELAMLRQQAREKNWQVVPADELSQVLATVSLEEKTFLSSKRRQRRLMQVLRGSDMAIMQKK